MKALDFAMFKTDDGSEFHFFISLNITGHLNKRKGKQAFKEHLVLKLCKDWLNKSLIYETFGIIETATTIKKHERPISKFCLTKGQLIIFVNMEQFSCPILKYGRCLCNKELPLPFLVIVFPKCEVETRRHLSYNSENTQSKHNENLDHSSGRFCLQCCNFSVTFCCN